jgi:hypothetical protein
VAQLAQRVVKQVLKLRHTRVAALLKMAKKGNIEWPTIESLREYLDSKERPAEVGERIWAERHSMKKVWRKVFLTKGKSPVDVKISAAKKLDRALEAIGFVRLQHYD